MIRRISSILLPILLATALAACGSKGPLVLPDQQPATKKHQPAPAPAQPAPAASGDLGQPR
jgi:predicted small lipoprotein YifL